MRVPLAPMGWPRAMAPAVDVDLVDVPLDRLVHGAGLRGEGFVGFDQDHFAAESQKKAEAAQREGRFKDEIAPVTIKTRKGDQIVEDDEYPPPRHHGGNARGAAPGVFR